MFTLVAVVCSNISCVSWAAPEIFTSSEACNQGVRRLYMVTKDAEDAKDAKDAKDAEEFTLVDAYCHRWNGKV